MTIAQYFEKIKDCCVLEEVKEDCDLEDNTESIILNGNERYFNFLSLFEECTKGVNHEIINQIVNTLGLLFISKNETEGNVCFANNRDLRPEFRQSFTLLDLLDYSYAILYSKVYDDVNKEFLKIPIPTDSVLFWKLVQTGSNLRTKENNNRDLQ